MGALTYLFLTKLKNRIKTLLKSPAKLIYVVFMLGLLVASIVSSGKGRQSSGPPRDIRELIAGAVVVYTMMFLLMVRSGFREGTSLFSMPDVNLIFPAPIKPRKVLFYGLFQQMGNFVLFGFFLLFQYSWMHNTYAVSFAGLFLIILGYVLSIFLGQLTAMVIYSATSSSESGSRAAKFALYAMESAFLIYILMYCLDKGFSLPVLVQAANTPVIKLLPVSGWLGSFISGFFLSSSFHMAMGAGLCVLLLLIEVGYILLSKMDFYEDVLKSTETNYSAIIAAKEGTVRDAVPGNVRVGRIGLGKGWGASAFYYKHLVENRRSRILLFDLSTLVFAAAPILFSVFMQNHGVLPVFAFATYMQMFFVAIGRLLKELTKPYIYLVPEPPMKKLLYSLIESFPKYVAEALLVFIPVSFILDLNLLTAVLCIFARLTFALLFTSGNILAERLWGGESSKGLAIAFYFAILILLTIPGIALSLVLLFAFPTGILSPENTVFVSVIICNIPVSLLSFYASRNMLSVAELNNR